MGKPAGGLELSLKEQALRPESGSVRAVLQRRGCVGTSGGKMMKDGERYGEGGSRVIFQNLARELGGCKNRTLASRKICGRGWAQLWSL